MYLQTARVYKASRANSTGKTPFVSMCTNVSFQRIRFCKGFRADITAIWSFSSVRSLVRNQMMTLGKCLFALLTSKWAFSCVTTDMTPHHLQTWILSVTYFTHIPSLTLIILNYRRQVQMLFRVLRPPNIYSLRFNWNFRMFFRCILHMKITLCTEVDTPIHKSHNLRLQCCYKKTHFILYG